MSSTAVQFVFVDDLEGRFVVIAQAHRHFLRVEVFSFLVRILAAVESLVPNRRPTGNRDACRVTVSSLKMRDAAGLSQSNRKGLTRST